MILELRLSSRFEEFEASLGYIARPCFKSQNLKQNKLIHLILLNSDPCLKIVRVYEIKQQESLAFCMCPSCLIWRREVAREAKRRSHGPVPCFKAIGPYYCLWTSPQLYLPQRTHMPWLMVWVPSLLQVEFVLFLSGLSFQLTVKPRILGKYCIFFNRR